MEVDKITGRRSGREESLTSRKSAVLRRKGHSTLRRGGYLRKNDSQKSKE
jgi:hypothetical protein